MTDESVRVGEGVDESGNNEFGGSTDVPQSGGGVIGSASRESPRASDQAGTAASTGLPIRPKAMAASQRTFGAESSSPLIKVGTAGAPTEPSPPRPKLRIVGRHCYRT